MRTSMRLRRALLHGGVVLAALASLPVRAADVLDTIRARGVLRVAMEGSYPPFNFIDPKTGALTGYDADVARLLAARLGVKAALVPVEWATILAGLGGGGYDVVISQVSITPKREGLYAFSVPYTYSSAQLILRSNDDARYRKLDDLKGRRLGVARGSIYEQLARQTAGLDVRSYPAAPETLQDLAFGRVDAALNDSLMVAYLVKTAALPIKPGPRVGEGERIGIAFQKGQPKLQAALDMALQQMQADGSLARVSRQWFGLDATRP